MPLPLAGAALLGAKGLIGKIAAGGSVKKIGGAVKGIGNIFKKAKSSKLVSGVKATVQDVKDFTAAASVTDPVARGIGEQIANAVQPERKFGGPGSPAGPPNPGAPSVSKSSAYLAVFVIVLLFVFTRK